MGGTASEHRVARARTLSAGLLAPILLLPLLERGGLAPVLVVAAVGLVMGAPAAVFEWRASEHPQKHTPTAAALRGGLELAAMLWACATVADAASAGALFPSGLAGLSGIWGGLLVWGLVAVSGRWPMLSGGLGGLSVLGLTIAALVSLRATGPWTLLEPRWEQWKSYIGPSIMLGVLLSGSGIGPWTAFVRRPPGDRHAPWGVIGLGITASTALAVEHASRYEAALGGSAAPSLPVQLLLTAMFTAGVCALSVRLERPTWRSLGSRVLAGMLLTVLLIGPAAGARPLVAGAIVPALAVVSLIAAALRSRGAERLLLAAVSVLLAAAIVIGWPGLPVRVLDAAMLGAFIVGIFWFVATRSVIVWRAA